MHQNYFTLMRELTPAIPGTFSIEPHACGNCVRLGKTGSILVAGPQADNAPNTLGNYDCGYNAEIWHNPGYEGCTNNHTSVVGGLRNGGTGLTAGEVIYEPGCTSSDCTESDFGKVTSVSFMCQWIRVLAWCDPYLAGV